MPEETDCLQKELGPGKRPLAPQPLGAAGKRVNTGRQPARQSGRKGAVPGTPAGALRYVLLLWGMDIAQAVGLTGIGRRRAERRVCLGGAAGLIREGNPKTRWKGEDA